MGLNLPPFNGLRLFEAAARCGSFKRAAQELNLTSGAISHGITSLEEWLGVELFDRSGGLALTPAGHHYLPYVKEAYRLSRKAQARPLPGVAWGTTRPPLPSVLSHKRNSRLISVELVQTITMTKAIK